MTLKQESLSATSRASNQARTGMGLRFQRIVLCGVALLSAWLAVQCSSGSADLNFIAKAGTACHNCRDCDSLTSTCVCKTCTDYAYDPDSGTVLSCGTNNTWDPIVQCAGGAAVKCSGQSGYILSCMDADGGAIPVP
jgi:hypothetical protein